MDHPSSTQMTCVLKLNTQTSGWDKSMHKLFKGVQDITYTIDATRGLAYLSGKISPDIILRIRKAKKHVELIHMDYGHVNPLPFTPQNPFQTVPNEFSHPCSRPSPMFQQPMSPISQHMYNNRQTPYMEQSPPHPTYPYMEQSPPHQLAYPYMEQSPPHQLAYPYMEQSPHHLAYPYMEQSPPHPAYPYMEQSPHHLAYPYIEQSPDHQLAYPYMEKPSPYYEPEVLYSPPQQLPTRDGVTGESQCRIM